MSLAKLLLLVGALVSWTYTLSAQYQLKVDRSLQKQLSSGSEVDVLVVLHDQLDLSSQPPQGSKLEKGRAVFEALWVHAAQSQLGVRELLRRMGIPHESFFIVNALAVTTRKEVVERLSILPAVASIRALPSHRMIDPQPTVQAQARAVGEIPWGLQLIGADEVWASDITGRGVVVGGQDTGVEWDHPALLNNYRGLLMDSVDHSYHWYDAIEAISPLHQDSMITDTTNPCGLNLQAPCDDARSSHGTHTMGTMVGYDRSTNTHVGVAPDAQWIAVRNMERGYGSPETYLRGFQWFLAPTDLHGQHPEPAMAPHVINNSWSCPTLEGCFESTYDLLEVAINNLRAAGIVVVASAGNSGAKGCATIASPPAIFEGSFTVGSVDQNDSISSFSSRGPAIIDGSKLWKPNVSAPGRGVLSATKGGGYGMLTGTSMAGPHVAGLVALMISANPSLAGDVEKIEQIIEHGRTTCGWPGSIDDQCKSISRRRCRKNRADY